ncbi:hypothetical protein [Streptomyces sp. NPDC012746]|uniref:hypothetical protein n=1 Tax=Streptomyces sp. NPDC012746 TaxID=3364845 RepID=UPI0036A609AA
MPTTSTVFDQFARRITDVTTQLAAHAIPLTTPAAPPANPNDPWASSSPKLVDRSTLAWCTAVLMLATHHHTAIDVQALSADALLHELGVSGLATLHRDLNHGAPIDYEYTRCPYCSGIGEDPTLPTCEELGCWPSDDIYGHEHLCPVCRGDHHEPQWKAVQRMDELEQLLVDAIEDKAPSRSWRWIRFPGQGQCS